MSCFRPRAVLGTLRMMVILLLSGHGDFTVGFHLRTSGGICSSSTSTTSLVFDNSRRRRPMLPTPPTCCLHAASVESSDDRPQTTAAAPRRPSRRSRGSTGGDDREGPRRSPRPARQRQRQEGSSSSRTNPATGTKELFDAAALTAAQSPNDDQLLLFSIAESNLKCITSMTATRQNKDHHDDDDKVDDDDEVDLEDHGTVSMMVIDSSPENERQQLRDEHESAQQHHRRRCCFEYKSLNDIAEGLSELFNADGDFRDALRMAIRRDIFHTTPSYANVSEKAARVLLDPESSLQGSWWCSGRQPPVPTIQQSAIKNINNDDGDENDEDGGSSHVGLRMKRLTRVLQDYQISLTGDAFMDRVGALCGTNPTTHWMDIVGVRDRATAHSWHMDTSGNSAAADSDSRTVLWGFPPRNNHTGCGVFSHLLPLSEPYQHSPPSRESSDDITNRQQREGRMDVPTLFHSDDPVDEIYIVRPLYAPGQELLVYRDIDVLHSSPDVTHRTSIMRFM